MSAPKTDRYLAPVDGQHCLRIDGRLRRLKLPLPAEPPLDVPPAACFLCHPERDRFDRGPWPEAAPLLRVVGNAFAFADAALLVAPDREADHARTPVDLAPATLAALLRAPDAAEFRARFGLADLDVVAFMNVGLRAAQSRLHPHLQVVGFAPATAIGGGADAAALAADLAAAAADGRTLALRHGAAIVPREPGMTAELWLPLPPRDAPAAAWEECAADLAQLCAACVRGLSGAYNLVLRYDAPRFVRLVPRGLSERAGLELAFPTVVGSVITANVRETVLLWSAALA